MSNAFCRFELRTTDPRAAGEFYRRLLGDDLWGRSIEVNSLPAEVVARGAVPHWLGYIGVEDVAGTMERFISRGASPLGSGPGHGAPCILRDPFGAIVALIREQCADVSNNRVPWQMLHVPNEAEAFAAYADVFGWRTIETFDVEGAHPGQQTFTWKTETVATGSVANTASSPGVHPHWMFFFRCESLERSLAVVRKSGGLALPAIEQPDGSCVAACEDPQHAAFGLYEGPNR